MRTPFHISYCNLMLVEYGEKLFNAVLSEMHSDDTDDHGIEILGRVGVLVPRLYIALC